jgi:hypothetical protein
LRPARIAHTVGNEASNVRFPLLLPPLAALAALATLLLPAFRSPPPAAAQALPQRGALPPAWINGTSCASEPVFQVHAYNPNTFILRQSL